MSEVDQNLQTYSSVQAIRKYSSASGLTACETYLFDKYVDQDLAILDLGVGAGRTSPYLASKASSYVGLDYSQPMIDVCREKFPPLRFICGDASDLQCFHASSFDAVVFSYNGIDAMRTDSGRACCFREVARVLRPGGYFIFSSHNARSIGLIANLRKYLFDRVKSKNAVEIASQVRALAVEKERSQLVRKFLRALKISAQISLRRLVMPKMYGGTGYYFDQSHGGLIQFASTPEYVREEATRSGFEIMEVVGNTYPADGPEHSIQWYYYVLRATVVK